MIPWLGLSPAFPPVDTAQEDPDGLLAAGGELTLPWLARAYGQGIFPWFSRGEPILWWSPSERMVLLPGQLKVSRSLDKTLRNRAYEVRCDSAFESVIRACAGAPREGQGGTWIVDEMVDAYVALHRAGHAHSFETWMDGELVGGLYGVAFGRMFYGESMFHRARDASKIAFVHMARYLEANGFAMIDCQFHTPHLASLGASLVSRQRFVAALAGLVAQPQPPGLWHYGYRNEPS